MKKTNRIATKKSIQGKFMVVFIAVFIFLGILLNTFDSQRTISTPQEISTDTKNSKTSLSESKLVTTQRSYTDEELHKFWDSELDPLIMKQWAKSQLPYNEINERYRTLNQSILDRTKNILKLTASTRYHLLSHNIEGCAGNTGGFKEIIIFVPAMLDTYNTLRDSSVARWREVLEAHVIVLLMHELEHTTSDHQPGNVSIDEELRAWEETCRYTLFPLGHTYNTPLIGGDGKLYLAWKEYVNNSSNRQWEQVIRERYGGLAR